MLPPAECRQVLHIAPHSGKVNCWPKHLESFAPTNQFQQARNPSICTSVITQVLIELLLGGQQSRRPSSEYNEPWKAYPSGDTGSLPLAYNLTVHAICVNRERAVLSIMIVSRREEIKDN